MTIHRTPNPIRLPAVFRDRLDLQRRHTRRWRWNGFAESCARHHAARFRIVLFREDAILWQSDKKEHSRLEEQSVERPLDTIDPSKSTYQFDQRRYRMS